MKRVDPHPSEHPDWPAWGSPEWAPMQEPTRLTALHRSQPMLMISPERFYAKVDKNGPIPAHCPELGPCHVWTACRLADGYGRFSIGSRTEGTRRTAPAHRVAFFLAHGRWPEPLACHHCDNRGCVNTAHLFEGDDADNAADMVAKGRGATGERNGAYTRPHSRRRGELNGRSKLTEQDVRDIRANYALCRVTKTELARRFGVGRTTLGQIIRGEIWVHVQRLEPGS